MNGASTAAKQQQPLGQPPATLPPAPPKAAPAASVATNGSKAGGKKKAEPPDPATMYESVRNRIAALEEEEVHGEEEERRVMEEARQSMKGLTETAIHAKYIDMYQEMKRLEREHAKEKQKLTKDKDASKSQLTKANQAKTRLENVGRELQKEIIAYIENKRLREDAARKAQLAADKEAELETMRLDMERRMSKARGKQLETREGVAETGDIVVKVVCKYRAELFFKINRKTKLSRLFNAWTDRMEGTPPTKKSGTPTPSPLRFMFTYMGRTLHEEETPEEACIEDADEILAVEMMDLTTPDMDEIPEHLRHKLKKVWSENPTETRKVAEDILDGIARERLKDILRQYELREKHFECVIRSKELEVLLAKARVEEQKHIIETERQRHAANETECIELRKQLEDTQGSQQRLMDKLIACCKEPSSERTTKLFEFLSIELAKRGRTVDSSADLPASAGAPAPAAAPDVAATPPPTALAAGGDSASDGS